MDDLILRAPEPEDVNIIYLWENSTDECHSSLRTGPLSRHQIQQFIDNYDGELYSQNALRYMIDFDGQTVGTIDVFDYDPRSRHAFVGIYIASRARRKGLALNALKSIERIMKSRVGMFSLAALVADDNTASQALFEKAGYEKCGLLKGWLTDGEDRIDGVLYQKILK